MYACLGTQMGVAMKQKLLITGFEPFGKDTINASWEAVSRLSDEVGGYELMKLQIPTVFGLAAETVLGAAKEFGPDVILCIGQAAKRDSVTPEVAALNLRDASIADNAGNAPQDVPVIQGGENAYFSSVPCRAIVDAVKAEGIPCVLSYSAGVYVCNDLFYTLLHHYHKTKTRVGFIHVPYLPEQAEEGGICLPLDVTMQALEIAIKAV